MFSRGGTTATLLLSNNTICFAVGVAESMPTLDMVYGVCT